MSNLKSNLNESNSNGIYSTEINMSSDSKISDWALDESNYRDDETYTSVFNKIGEAVNESETLFDFLQKALSIFYYTKFSIFILLIMAIFHLTMIYTGINHLENCPKQPKIPVYIFICGGVGFLKCLQLIWIQIQKHSDFDDYIYTNYRSNSFGNDTQNNVSSSMIDREEQRLNKGSRVTDAIISTFLFIWFLIGNYWIWSIYQPNYEMELLEPNNWCSKKLYIFSIVHLYTYYSICGFIVLLVILLTIFTQIPCLILRFQDS
ncbi:unnamed protein product [Brachionus calyciflorus]|uniref:Transmembrane protein n=1 Tax=Brachionus calyciflorus TaxID=104777 RepID=A0A813WD01_9BILA|nr:unnamed protein product [Brachionus calyciflorus]